MEKDPPKPAGERTGRAAEASLNAALSDLEQMLERRRSSGHAGTRGAPPSPDGAPRTDGGARAKRAEGAQQYTIPLLDDVVVPGADAVSRKPSIERHAAQSTSGEEPVDEVYRKILERLASEIEVIVQTRVESAVQDAADRIRAEIRNHLEIVLPEIVDELEELARERR